MDTDFRELEESLWRAETRFDREYMEGVLARDFLEFGRSGRRYDREAALAAEGDSFRARLPFENFGVSELAPDVVLVTYISEVQYETTERANRSSIWVRAGDNWRLRFHQGTPV